MYLTDFWRQVDPWQEAERIQKEMNRMFNGVSESGMDTCTPINIWANNQEAIVTSELPGLDVKDIHLSVKDNVLTIEGTRPELDVPKESTIHRLERGSGPFKRMIRLPFAVEPAKIQAKFDAGCLNVTLPRADSDKPKKIEIKIA